MPVPISRRDLIGRHAKRYIGEPTRKMLLAGSFAEEFLKVPAVCRSAVEVPSRYEFIQGAWSVFLIERVLMDGRAHRQQIVPVSVVHLPVSKHADCYEDEQNEQKRRRVESVSVHNVRSSMSG